MAPLGTFALSEGANLPGWTHMAVVLQAVARNNVLSVLTSGWKLREFDKSVCNKNATKPIASTRIRHPLHDWCMVLKGTDGSALSEKFAQAISAHFHPRSQYGWDGNVPRSAARSVVRTIKMSV
jgi:hypothetical protein